MDFEIAHIPESVRQYWQRMNEVISLFDTLPETIPTPDFWLMQYSVARMIVRRMNFEQEAFGFLDRKEIDVVSLNPLFEAVSAAGQ